MPFLEQDDMREVGKEFARGLGKTPDEALRQLGRSRREHYDIFLSQTIRDAEIVLGVYSVLTNMGHAVFCDWLEAPSPSRDEVTPANAEFIRDTMRISDALLFLDTQNADQSLWMCWELGWFDAAKGLVAILPVLRKETKSYRQREFLGLYPYVEVTEEWKLKIVRPNVRGPNGITIFEAPNSRPFNVWRKHPDDPMRPRTPGYANRRF
ncbi:MULTISPECIES: hypothetical protein [unclassified Rhizobium]|uniref:hypothetical protein n=1 Tax=unclassified Rhizobium TaxID=2613769 RepID=UPI001A993C39|nr:MULTISPECIES: hypothetical protein [unclassified Rhizobium]MBX5164524.1 toll-Interleukin receptor [Rhizobium sp. NZLR4b]MBX5190840.1 toll-Interleukin receptor [Rhizobium sp. NZLR3b]MBX5204455.1 toll-Interleukin receptor [Rhizobium sp. NZLR1]QSZ24675.1 hypothetical protein J3O30_30470 [Rhizobium sp. NZLR1]